MVVFLGRITDSNSGAKRKNREASNNVVLGPSGFDAATATAGVELADSPTLRNQARVAAERLVSALQIAQVKSCEWNDEELATGLVDTALSECLRSLAATGCWGRANQIASNELWRVAESWLHHGWLHHQARFKPRGYAGDFELMNRLWNKQVTDQGLGRYFDQFFQRQAAVEAVRSRAEQTAYVLTSDCLDSDKRTFHVVSVGSGPAIEIELAVRRLPEAIRRRLKVTLLDLDDDALSYCGNRLSEVLAAEQIDCRRENLFRIAKEAEPAEILGEPDFLLCTGLFDYLGTESASALLGVLWRSLAPGGRLLVGNFAPHCPSRAYMEWIGNWYLIYRTVDELRELGLAAGIPPERIQIGAERLGINLFLNAVKP
jgi:extracellular factor (EF) 3-hydroxypalmitic acid methyl ester biosynthesis protein